MQDRNKNEIKNGDHVWLYADDRDLWEVLESQNKALVVKIKNLSTGTEIDVNPNGLIKHAK